MKPMSKVGAALGLFLMDKDGNPQPAKSAAEWAVEFFKQDRRIAVDKIGRAQLSTVFLGVDHGCLSADPILFETAVLYPDGDVQIIARYATRAAALKGHRNVLRFLTDKHGCTVH